MKTIDARGLACPQPVLLTHKALQEHDEVTTLVDNQVATENLRRLATGKGYEVQVRSDPDGYLVHLRHPGRTPELPGMSAAPDPAPEPQGTQGGTGLLLTADALGHGSEELGQLLIRTFFHTLGESQTPPSTAIFMNSGVKLAVEGSPVLEDLGILAGKGMAILVCGTCLKHFDLMERLAVGQVSNMYEISEHLLGAPRVLRM